MAARRGRRQGETADRRKFTNSDSAKKLAKDTVPGFPAAPSTSIHMPCLCTRLDQVAGRRHATPPPVSGAWRAPYCPPGRVGWLLPCGVGDADTCQVCGRWHSCPVSGLQREWCGHHCGHAERPACCSRRMSPMTSRATERATAALLRSVLEEVDAGRIDADEPQAKRLLRRIEGAVSALDPDPAN